MPKLKQVLNKYHTEGAIFTKLSQLVDLPFENVVDLRVLDLDFMTQFGQRQTSCLVDDLLDNPTMFDDLELVRDDLGNYIVTINNIRVGYSKTERPLLETLCILIWQRYGVNWKKLYETMSLKYNPIHNYDMTEQENTDYKGDDESKENTILNASGSTINTEKTENDITTDTNTYGFNSSNPTPTGKDITDNTTDVNGSTTTSNSNEGETESNRSSSSNTKRKMNRSGNIGVTTTQKMIEEERKVWVYDYFKIIFKQVADLLTSKIYVL